MNTHKLVGRKRLSRMKKDGTLVWFETGSELSPTPEELSAFPDRFAKIEPAEEQEETKAPPVGGFDITALTAEEAIERVKTGAISAEDALAQELARPKGPRATLVKKLESIIGG